MSKTRLYWLHVLSPTHVGTGRGVGYIDLPIQRDKVTNWPLVPGSAFKGVWADCFGATDKERKKDTEEGRLLRAAFGIASDQADKSNSGALIPTDARLVCLPVRSFRGTFAWCVSPLSLMLLHRDLNLVQVSNLPEPPDSGNNESIIYHASDTVLTEGNRIFLEDLDFTAEKSDIAEAWARKIACWVFPDDPKWKAIFVKRFALVPDAVFDFLTETGTEVTARVKIDDDTKTVVEGALWNEEALPAETILGGFVSCDRVYPKQTNVSTPDKLIETYATQPLILQIGGKATVGRGRVRCVFTSIGGRSHATDEQPEDGSGGVYVRP